MRILLAMLTCVLSSCSIISHHAPANNLNKRELHSELLSLAKELPEKDALERLRSVFAAELRRRPENGYAHLLNALTYQLDESRPESRDLAKVGYEAATKFSPGYFWADYLAGDLAFENHEFGKALEFFSRAIQDDSKKPLGFLALAASAYYSGQLEFAKLCIERALELAPKDGEVARAAAYIFAASGDRARVEHLISNDSVVIPSEEFVADRSRLDQLVRLANVNETTAPTNSQVTQDQGAGQQGQIAVEVTLLLSQNAQTNRNGINLLDGLSIQFGGTHSYVRDNSSGSLITQRTLTSSIEIPAVNYNLNIFNTQDDYYEVLARPSLVAATGTTSEFFIGKTVILGVSGVNLGTIAPIDVGTSVKATPLEILGKKAKFKIEAGRSFFAQDSGGTFEESLTTFKQSVNATVEVEFGKTLILSGLYEGVKIGGSTGVPVLRSIPVLNQLFSEQDHSTHKDAALVLVTPRLPGAIETKTEEYSAESLGKLLEFWNAGVQPVSGVDEIVARFKRPKITTVAQTGDIQIPALHNDPLLQQVLQDTLPKML